MGDFNNDSFQDVVVADAILLGNGDGTFRTQLLTSARTALSIVAGYFNDDGILDIAHTTPMDQGVWIRIGNGDGTFQSPIFSPVAHSSSVAVGYFNRDAIADLAVVSNGGTV